MLYKNAVKSTTLLAHNMKIDHFAEVTSTNDIAREGDYTHGDVVVADVQTAGRGQRGNRWESAGGANLTFSMVLRPTFLAVADQFLLSEAVALAIVDMLGDYGITAQVKWPNDIYVDGRKIAGILIENDIMGAAMSRSIVGIGLNVNQTEFDPSLPGPISMKLASGRYFDRGDTLTRLLKTLTVRCESLARGASDTIIRDYHHHLYRLGEPAQYTLPDGTVFTGTIKRVRPSGELVVHHADSSVGEYLFKEIGYSK